MELYIGWCTGYMALQYHYEEALIEKNMDKTQSVNNPEFAIFSKKYYDEINDLKSDKIYDFCFIGSISSNIERRRWVIEFVKIFFTSNSIFINTDDDDNWISLGDFDLTHKKLGFCPKNSGFTDDRKSQYRIVDNENKFYFETMRQSRFCLCPAGDAPWSFRFYEILMCKSIPLTESWHHTYRTKEEACLNILYNF